MIGMIDALSMMVPRRSRRRSPRRTPRASRLRQGPARRRKRPPTSQASRPATGAVMIGPIIASRRMTAKVRPATPTAAASVGSVAAGCRRCRSGSRPKRTGPGPAPPPHACRHGPARPRRARPAYPRTPAASRSCRCPPWHGAHRRGASTFLPDLHPGHWGRDIPRVVASVSSCARAGRAKAAAAIRGRTDGVGSGRGHSCPLGASGRRRARLRAVRGRRPAPRRVAGRDGSCSSGPTRPRRNRRHAPPVVARRGPGRRRKAAGCGPPQAAGPRPVCPAACPGKVAAPPADRSCRALALKGQQCP